MGSLLAVIGNAPADVRETRLRRMANRSPYRGLLQSISHGDLSLGVQARTDESSLFQDDHLMVGVHGRVFEDTPSISGDREISAAERMARAWSNSGSGCLPKIDGEFSLLVHDKHAATTHACTSLSMSRHLYWARGGDALVFASEIRQVAIGAGIDQRLDLEAVVQTLLFDGLVLDTERTQYNGINRIFPPRLYEISADTSNPLVRGDYWTPPETTAIDAADRPMLARKLIDLLSVSLKPMLPGAGISLSGGYDSGTLWILAQMLAKQNGNRQLAPKAYSLTFPTSAHDESATIRSLLEQTHSDATLIDMEELKPSAFVASHVAGIDHIPTVPTLHYADVLAKRMRADNLTRRITGIGAEAWLHVNATYAADLLRRGRLIPLFVDALRYQHYSPRYQGRAKRLLRFLEAAVAPSGGPFPLWRRGGPPDWLAPRWHELCRTTCDTIDAVWGREGYGRGTRWFALTFFGALGGTERIEQTCERYGVELACPFLRRAIARFGFAVPARELCGGRHAKYLLRQCASEALGAEPAWTRHGVAHGPAFARDAALILDLGQARDWQLIDAGVVSAGALEHIIESTKRGHPVLRTWGSIAYAERYLRSYGY